MQLGPRSPRLAIALAAIGLTVCASGETALPVNSPFLPAGNAATGPATALTGGFQFVAVLTEGSKTSVDLFDPTTKTSRWIPVRGEVDGIAVLAYDASRSEAVIRVGGMEKHLTLRKEGNVISGANATSGAATIAATSMAAAPILTPGAKPAPATTPPTVTKEQNEARMLVSDLLEISAAQRKAHEEAQSKKTSAPVQQPAKPAGQ